MGTPAANTAEFHRKSSTVEDEFQKIKPAELGKVERLRPRKYSVLASDIDIQSQRPGSSSGEVGQHKSIPPKRISVSVVSATSTYATRIDYVGKGFWCTSKGYRKIAWILCVVQAVSMMLWVTSILLVKYYWPARHLTGRFLPGYLTTGRARMIIFACLGSEPIISFILLGICLVLAKKQIRWIRFFYVVNSWLCIVLIVTGIFVMSFSVNSNNHVNVRAKLYEILTKYDDNATLEQVLEVADTKVDYTAKSDWDELQYFYKCCGIESEENWYAVRNFFEEDEIENDPSYWRVPASCCRSTNRLEIQKCTRCPAKNLLLLWQPRRGCLEPFKQLLASLSALAGVQVFSNWIIQGMSIVIMTSYYASMRASDGTGYKRSARTYFCELVCMCCDRKRKVRRPKSDWALPVNEVVQRVYE